MVKIDVLFGESHEVATWQKKASQGDGSSDSLESQKNRPLDLPLTCDNLSCVKSRVI